MSKLAKEYGDKLAVTFEVDGSEVKLTPAIVQDYIVGTDTNITVQEYKFFVELCKQRKLNPFLKEAYLIKYSERQPAQIVVGKDAIVKRAVKHPMFNGREQGIIVLNDTTGEFTYRKGTFKLSAEQVVGGWAKVFRKDWEYPVEISVSFDEVAQRKGDGVLNANWKSKGATMVEKVALVRALREAFVEDLAGMYDKDEAWNEKELGNDKIIIEQEDIIETEEALEVEE